MSHQNINSVRLLANAGGRSLAGIGGFFSRLLYGCLSSVNVVCCTGTGTAIGRSSVQGSPAECMCLCVIGVNNNPYAYSE